MRLLFIDRHYWPDTSPHSTILRMTAEHLASDGHDVTVFTAQPGYNDIQHARQPSQENLGGVNVRRVRFGPERKRIRMLWVLNSIYFLARAWFHAVFVRRYDRVVVTTSLPILAAFTARMIAFFSRTKYILHAQDIHPEAARCAGHLSKSWLYSILRRIDQHSHSHAELIVAIGNDLYRTLSARGTSHSRIRIVHNPALHCYEKSDVALPPLFNSDDDCFRILFAGNVGHFQALEHVIEAAHLLKSHLDIQFIFMGEGLAKPTLRAQAGPLENATVHFLPFQPLEVAIKAIGASDLGIISLRTGMYNYAFPSKTAMYLTEGCPVLAVIEQESELASLVNANRLGVVASEHSGAAIAEAILKVYTHRNDNRGMNRERIKRWSQRLFDPRNSLQSWTELMRDERLEVRHSHAA